MKLFATYGGFHGGRSTEIRVTPGVSKEDVLTLARQGLEKDEYLGELILTDDNNRQIAVILKKWKKWHQEPAWTADADTQWAAFLKTL